MFAGSLQRPRLMAGFFVSTLQILPALFQLPGVKNFAQGPLQAFEIGLEQIPGPWPDLRTVKIDQVHRIFAANEDVARIQVRVNQPMIMEVPDTCTCCNPHRRVALQNVRQISQGNNIQQSPGHQVPGIEQPFP